MIMELGDGMMSSAVTDSKVVLAEGKVISVINSDFEVEKEFHIESDVYIHGWLKDNYILGSTSTDTILFDFITGKTI